MSSTAYPPEQNKRKKQQQWWMSNRKVVERYLKEARALVATQTPADVSTALPLLDAALSVSPRNGAALELKARSLLLVRRFKDVAEMLKDYIPSFKSSDVDTTTSSFGSDVSQQLSRERVKLLRSVSDTSESGGIGFRCLSVAELKEKVLRRISKGSEDEGYWRYIVLGQACYHLGMMDDAIILLQSGRRLATSSHRRYSHHLRHDTFSTTTTSPNSGFESAAKLVTHVKLLLRRLSAATAALDAHLSSESIRHFSKILDSRRAIPSPFAAACLVGRASAHRSAGRLADAVADCNRALTLDPSSIPALRLRSDVLESVRALPDCLRDLDHLKLLYDAILRNGKLPGSAWRPHYDVRYRDVPACLRALNSRIQELKQRVAKGEACCVDYYRLIGVRRGCSRTELERAHLVLSLRHRPEKAAAFVERVEFEDGYRDVETVTNQARMSALILYRMLQMGYSSIMAALLEEEAAVASRKKVLMEAMVGGGFCRDVVTVGGFGRGIPVQCEV